ncbi:uncharacterized protein A4U43_C06F4790 [Asparagus officinalis]|uniref:Uncharacterized protein n=1 Tax=Asparagus officinalis TaxID=4686 RepID=A0A5P1EK57_ASPOF|nr:uncharacterized protein A4U43_C06F4790 [Asparagus officinalis]
MLGIKVPRFLPQVVKLSAAEVLAPLVLPAYDVKLVIHVTNRTKLPATSHPGDLILSLPIEVVYLSGVQDLEPRTDPADDESNAVQSVEANKHRGLIMSGPLNHRSEDNSYLHTTEPSIPLPEMRRWVPTQTDSLSNNEKQGSQGRVERLRRPRS